MRSARERRSEDQRVRAAGKAGGADKLQQKSPAEFFAENKNIAGFDNVGRKGCAAGRANT